jgi:hypothetical protein
MSISAREAAQQLTKSLIDLLPDRHYPHNLNKRLAQDLKLCDFPEAPINFDGAFIFFNKFFAEISHPNIMSYGWQRGPIVFPNILLAIKKSGDRLRTFRRIIIKTAKEHCHYEALFAVMCEALHHPVGYYERFNSQNGRDFLLKAMIMVRIEQRRRFPPGPNCKLTNVFHFSLDKILEMIKKKNGMHNHEEVRLYMKKKLSVYNSMWNNTYTSLISRLLQVKPDFFSDFKSDLKAFYRYIMQYETKESFWTCLMESMMPRFSRALEQSYIYDESKKLWIVYWYIRYRNDRRSMPKESRESFNDLMTRIVKTGEMAFPFKDPPRLFKTNGEIFKAALRWESVPTSDLLEICYRSHVKSQYGPIPSQCVLAASVRRKLYEVKIIKAAVKIQKMARRSLWQFYLKRLIAAMVINAKVLIASAAKRFFIRQDFFERLKKYRHNQRFKAEYLIIQALTRTKQRAEYIIQKTAATDLSRFLKVRSAAIFCKKFQKFVKDLSCYDCPLCFEELSSVQIDMIQPCGHIHCKNCFDQIGKRCSCCRAQFLPKDCKSVSTFLSQSNPKFFFTRENSEKKAAIKVITKWWTIKRSLLAETRNASLREIRKKAGQ